MIFTCTQSEHDFTVRILHKPKRGKLVTLSDYPTKCDFDETEKTWYCTVKAAGCTEGETTGTLGIINQKDFFWEAYTAEEVD